MDLWVKPLLNNALLSGSTATWTQQHLLGSSVSGYLYLEGHGPRPSARDTTRYPNSISS
jgi:hypothetical protein